jgi:hypothetical protein
MRSKNADFLKQGLIDQARKTTPSQRLDLFVEHSRRMRLLRDLGDARRSLPREPDRPDDR